MSGAGEPSEQWDFLTNHAHVLACIAREPDVRIRRMAECTGITERSVQAIVTQLVQAGYLTRHRVGRPPGPGSSRPGCRRSPGLTPHSSRSNPAAATVREADDRLHPLAAHATTPLKEVGLLRAGDSATRFGRR